MIFIFAFTSAVTDLMSTAPRTQCSSSFLYKSACNPVTQLPPFFLEPERRTNTSLATQSGGVLHKMTEVEIFKDNPRITQIVIDKRGDTWIELYNPVLRLPEFTIDSSSEHTGNHGNVPDAPDVPPAEEPEEVFHFLVTSSQLCNVSDYFEAMFAHNFQEATRDPENAKFHIVAQELNPKALEILLNIAHCLVKKVPHKIEDVELLTHLSVAVDFYRMHDVVRMHSKEWAEGLKISGHPLLDQDELAHDPIMTGRSFRGRKAGGQGYDRKAVMWLQILRVFPDREMYREVCQLVIWHGRRPFQHLDLPVQAISSKSLEDSRNRHACF